MQNLNFTISARGENFAKQAQGEILTMWSNSNKNFEKPKFAFNLGLSC